MEQTNGNQTTSRRTKIQMLELLREYDGHPGITVKDFCSLHQISEGSFYSARKRHRSADTIKNYDTIQVVGKIMDLSPGYCGIICAGGCIKVKLKQKLANYLYDEVYIVTASLGSSAKIGKNVNVVATLLRSSDNECYYKNVSCRIDSKGIPFYKLSETETRKSKVKLCITRGF
jgi:hypothetical protein